MGNTSSSNTSPSSSRTPRSQSPSTTRRARSPARNGAAHRDTYSPPPQQQPHPNRPLKHKKRSLELPDLASLTLTPAAPSSGPSKASSPIAIPTSAIPANYSRPKLGSTPQMSEIATIPPPTAPHLTKPPDPGPVARNSTFSLVGRKSNRPDDAVRKKFKRATIRASIAPGFTVPRSDESGKVIEEGPEGDQVSVYVSWKAGGQNVFLAGKYNNSWKGKVKLSYDPATQCHATTIYLPPGNHHIKFIVDDQWMLSDELPTCTDDDGNFVNYIDVSSNEKEWGSAWWGDGQDESDDDTNLPWTSVIPPHLPISAQMEENYLLQTSQSPSAYHHHMHPPPLPPPTPHPPTLPRHLDKVILNTRPIASSSSSARLLPSHNRTERSRQIRLLEGNDGPNGDDNSVLPVPSHSVVGHLSTSAIRNGVLAVGTTNRYKNKYITTIYYYPT